MRKRFISRTAEVAARRLAAPRNVSAWFSCHANPLILEPCNFPVSARWHLRRYTCYRSYRVVTACFGRSRSSVLMELAANSASTASDATKRSLASSGPCATCRGLRYPRCQQRRILVTCYGHVRILTANSVHSAAQARRGLSFKYRLGVGAARLAKVPTVEHEPRNLQQTCFAAAKQAHKEILQSSYPADNVATIDKEQDGLSQLLMCSSKTFSAVVCTLRPDACAGLVACLQQQLHVPQALGA